MLTIGTAGHIDHGKSAIIRRLTGTDPDRLPEEKLRGMTIDLGFAFREVQDQGRIAFVDVPGHERFVKNMIAGAGGIDLVMLVIAADDGWMPQSQEHFQIVRLLGVRQGIIVINKCDLVTDADWLDLLEDDVRDKVADSFLAEAPVFRVSAQNGQGFDELARYIDSLPKEISARRDIGKARLSIDRSFVLHGIGGVVTGTLRGGSLETGQMVTIWPGQVTGKIRSLRANNSDVSTALSGQRTAVSLSGVDKDHLVRGGVISQREDLSYFKDNPVLVLSVELLSESKVALINRRRAILITGTTEVEGEIRLYRRRSLKSSEQGIVFFKPDQPVFSMLGDRFIVRLPTPMVTLGGGQIIDHLPHFPRVRDIATYEYLENRGDGNLRNLILSELQKNLFAVQDHLLENAAVFGNQVKKELKALSTEKLVGKFRTWVYDITAVNDAVELFKSRLLSYLDENPHLKGLPRDQLLQLSTLSQSRSELLIEYMIADGTLVRSSDKLNLVGRGMSLEGKIKKHHHEIIEAIEQSPFAPPRLPDLVKAGKDAKEAVRYILEANEGHKCGAEFIFANTAWDEIVAFIRHHLEQNGSLEVATLKNKFGMTRKYAIPIMEETDRIKLTRRDGDVRVKGENFEVKDTDL